MSSISASTIVIVLVAVLITVFILVVILYKPPRHLNIHSSFKPDENNGNSIIEVSIQNSGKAREKLTPPYLKFSTGLHTKKYQVANEFVNCRFPRILKRGEEMVCEINISHYRELLEKEHFNPVHLNILVDDMVGLEFKSETLDL